MKGEEVVYLWKRLLFLIYGHLLIWNLGCSFLLFYQIGHRLFLLLLSCCSCFRVNFVDSMFWFCFRSGLLVHLICTFFSMWQFCFVFKRKLWNRFVILKWLVHSLNLVYISILNFWTVILKQAMSHIIVCYLLFRFYHI